MSQYKIYCLGCEQTNACKCGTTEKHFRFTDKLRPPTHTRNKVVWRKFLFACPQFGNCVPDHLIEDFVAFLKKLRHNGFLNGRNWYVPRKAN